MKQSVAAACRRTVTPTGAKQKWQCGVKNKFTKIDSIKKSNNKEYIYITETTVNDHYNNHNDGMIISPCVLCVVCRCRRRSSMQS